MFWRNSSFWQIGLVCKASSVVSHQTRWHNKRILIKDYSVSRDFPWIENHKLNLQLITCTYFAIVLLFYLAGCSLHLVLLKNTLSHFSFYAIFSSYIFICMLFFLRLLLIRTPRLLLIRSYTFYSYVFHLHTFHWYTFHSYTLH